MTSFYSKCTRKERESIPVHFCQKNFFLPLFLENGHLKDLRPKKPYKCEIINRNLWILVLFAGATLDKDTRSVCQCWLIYLFWHQVISDCLLTSSVQLHIILLRPQQGQKNKLPVAEINHKQSWALTASKNTNSVLRNLLMFHRYQNLSNWEKNQWHVFQDEMLLSCLYLCLHWYHTLKKDEYKWVDSFKEWIIYLKAEWHREEETEISHRLVHSPNGCHKSGLRQAKARIQDPVASSGSPKPVRRVQGPKASSPSSPGVLSESWKWSSWDFNQSSYRMSRSQATA